MGLMIGQLFLIEMVRFPDFLGWGYTRMGKPQGNDYETARFFPLAQFS